MMNDNLIPTLPHDIAVEVPARVYKDRLEPIAFPNYPKGMLALLRNYSGVYDLTAEAILPGERSNVVQAVLANPVVDFYHGVEELVDLMIERQRPWLNYLTAAVD